MEETIKCAITVLYKILDEVSPTHAFIPFTLSLIERIRNFKGASCIFDNTPIFKRGTNIESINGVYLIVTGSTFFWGAPIVNSNETMRTSGFSISFLDEIELILKHTQEELLVYINHPFKYEAARILYGKKLEGKDLIIDLETLLLEEPNHPFFY